MAATTTRSTVPDRIVEWRSRLAVLVAGLVLFETLSGLSIWLLPFSVPNQFLVLLHTAAGLFFLIPFIIYLARHWWRYRSWAWSHSMVTGYVAFAAVALNAASGLVLTAQALFGTRISYIWDTIHIVTTFAILAFLVTHVVAILISDRKGRSPELSQLWAVQRKWIIGIVGVTAVGFLALAGLVWQYEPVEWVNEFPEGYEHEEGESPFRPSLAMTASGGAYDDRSLTGSEGCGTRGCHEQIYDEWAVSAHRWSSMDPAFQAIQEVMATQNGPQSTRYCGGCHDPASLFAGTKNVLTDNLTSLRGYQEGVSCIVCHAIRETDLKGNANYTIVQPERYIYEVDDRSTPKFLSDFLIRAYPRKHIDVFAKRLFKTPEYCAACHKQFIDEEVNQVGWVQLQNQYDNWRTSKWNPEGEPEKVVECRECHMPLIASNDPAAGDELDSYRTASDKKHRDHRFIGANSMIPQLLLLDNWKEHSELTTAWLQGKRPIPEIEYKWEAGPAVAVRIDCPDTVRAGEPVDVRVFITSNKVGHDFPTGPLDIIQSWINLVVTDDRGDVVFRSGDVNEENFVQPGSFMFKAEPVDQYGNLIDRHNLWEMVGVRYRRAIYPGFSDVANYQFSCPSELASIDEQRADTEPVARDFVVNASNEDRTLHIQAHLDYRKVDQYLLNFIFGEDSGLTAPVIRMASDEKTVHIGGI